MRELPDIDTLRRALGTRDWRWLERALPAVRPQDLATVFRDLEPYTWVYVYKLLDDRRAVAVFGFLQPGERRSLFQALTTGERQRLLRHMALDDLVAFVTETEATPTCDQVLDCLDARRRAHVERLRQYPPESAGRLMVTEVLRLPAVWTVRAAIDHVRALSSRAETVDQLAVVTGQGRLLGMVALAELLLAPDDMSVAEFEPLHRVSVDPREDRGEAVRLAQHYDLTVVPVVDASSGSLLGILTMDDLLDVVEEEVTEDFLKMGSVGAMPVSLSEARPSLLYRKRVGWLLLLVFMNIFAGAAIARYEATIEAVIALVFFLPLIVDSGGNAGTQSATLMVRALAIGDVRVGDWFRLWGKELLISLALGGTLALAVSLPGFWRGGADLALAVSMAMLAVVVAGSMIGMLLPFLFARLGLDSATASAPLVTSIADVCGVLIYFSIAAMLFGAP